MILGIAGPPYIVKLLPSEIASSGYIVQFLLNVRDPELMLVGESPPWFVRSRISKTSSNRLTER